MSPLLFSIVLDRVLRAAMIHCRGTHVRLDGKRVVCSLLAYADDLAVMCESVDDLQHDLNVITDALAAAGLRVSVKKTEWMEIARLPSALEREQRLCSDLPPGFQWKDGVAWWPRREDPEGRPIPCPVQGCTGRASRNDALARHLRQVHGLLASVGPKGPRASTKTKAESQQIAQQQPQTRRSLQVNGVTLQKVEKFKYLGRIFSTSATDDDAVRARLQICNATFHSLRKQWASLRAALSRSTKLVVVRAVLLAQLIYGCESWVLCATTAHLIRVSVDRILRHATGLQPCMVDGTLRYPSRARLYAAARMDDIINTIAARQLRFWGHEIRRGGLPVMTLCAEFERGRAAVGLNDCHMPRGYVGNLAARVGLSLEDAFDRARWQEGVKRLRQTIMYAEG